jgi:hypothetical protein
MVKNERLPQRYLFFSYFSVPSTLICPNKPRKIFFNPDFFVGILLGISVFFSEYILKNQIIISAIPMPSCPKGQILGGAAAFGTVAGVRAQQDGKSHFSLSSSWEKPARVAAMSVYLQADMRGPSLTGFGYFPLLTPAHHALRLMGMSTSTWGRRKSEFSEMF